MGRTPTEPTPFVPWPRAAGASAGARALHAALVGVCAVLLCVAAACSYTFDDAAAWPTVGTAVDVRGLQHVVIPRLRDLPLDDWFALLPGADGATWMAFYPAEPALPVRLVRLGDPALEETRPAGWIHRGAVYVFDYPNNDIVVHRPGAPVDPRIHVSDLKNIYADFSDDDELLGWGEKDKPLTLMNVARTDGSYERPISFEGAMYPGPGGMFAGGFVWVATDRLRFYSMRRGVNDFDDTVALVPMPGSAFMLRYLEAERIFVRCDSQGLTAFPVGGTPQTLLDASCEWLTGGSGFTDACPPGCHEDTCPMTCSTTSDCEEHSGRILYVRGCNKPPGCIIGSVSPDGQQRDSVTVTTIMVDQCGSHVATLDINGIGISSSDALYRFAIPARVDGRPVMKRGRSLHFSRDGTRVRFLENTANTGGTGDLMTGPVEGPYEVIAHNVRRYDELDDGRLIALVNRAYVGVHNRLVLVDERRRTMTRFVDAARDYRLIPGGREVMVWMVAVGTEDELPADWVRVPIPN